MYILLITLFLVSWEYDKDFAEDELIIATFQDFGTCAKCYISPAAEIEKMEHYIPKDVRIIAFVKCKRKVELKEYTKYTAWRYEVMMDKNDLKSQLGLDIMTALVLMNGQGKIIKKYSYDDIGNSSKEITKYLNDL